MLSFMAIIYDLGSIKVDIFLKDCRNCHEHHLAITICTILSHHVCYLLLFQVSCFSVNSFKIKNLEIFFANVMLQQVFE